MGFSVLARARSKEKSYPPSLGLPWTCCVPSVLQGRTPTPSHGLVQMDAVGLGESETDSIPQHNSFTWQQAAKCLPLNYTSLVF